MINKNKNKNKRIRNKIIRSYSFKRKYFLSYYSFYIYKIDTKEILAVYYHNLFKRTTKVINKKNIEKDLHFQELHISDYIKDNTIIKMIYIKKIYYIKPKNKQKAIKKLTSINNDILKNTNNSILFETKLTDINIKKEIVKIRNIFYKLKKNYGVFIVWSF